MLESIWSECWIWLSSCLMNLGRIALFAAGIVLCVGILHRMTRENEGIKLFVWGVFGFFAEYVIISVVLFQADRWGITTTLLIAAAVDGAAYGWLFFRDRRKRISGRIQFSIGSYWPMFCLCLGAAVLVQDHNGYFGMQQDQGVYQTAAVAMISGNWENVMELDVYRKIPEEDRERYMHVVPTEINGFYFYEEDLEGLYTMEFASDATGYFHGIPTYPALLALWGGMFGIRSMGGIQTVLLVLLLALGYLLLSQLGCKKSLAVLGCGIVAVSPMVLWTAHSALTEMYLACALTAFLYFLSQEGRWGIWLSAVAIISWGCVHFSIYILMPMVILIYLGMYVRYKEKTYIEVGILTTFCFWFVINLTRMISTGYFYKNITPLIDLLPWLDRENVMGFITLACVTVLALGLIILILGSDGGEQDDRAKSGKKKGNAKGRKELCSERKEGDRDKRGTAETKGLFVGVWRRALGEEGLAKRNLRNRMCDWAVRILVATWCVLAVKQAVELGLQGGEEGQITSSVTGYCLLAGVVMLPIGLTGILAKPRLLWKDKASASLGALFVYCIMIYGIAFRRDIGYYFYYGRYLVPFIPLVVWQGIQALQMLKGKIGMAAWGIAAAAQVILLPYDLVLTVQKDDTRMSWEALEQIREKIGSEDVLIIEDSLLPTCYLPLTYLVEGDVVPQMHYPPEEIMKRYSVGKEQVYYLSSGRSEVGGAATVLRIGYVASEDQQKGERGLLGLPIRMTSETRHLQLDCLLQERYVYTAEDNCWINMFMDEKGSRWGYGSEYGLSVCLPKDDYWMTVSLGEAVPLDVYGIEFYPVQVYVNGLYLEEIRIYRENEEGELIFEIPFIYLREGKNEILFRSEPWKPRDFGKMDYREMGINISRVRFVAE